MKSIIDPTETDRTNAAAHLGIHRNTLYRVLKGHYPDRGSYATRYRAFLAEHAANAA